MKWIAYTDGACAPTNPGPSGWGAVLIAPDGRVLYRREGEIDLLELRRTILANLQTDYTGFREYWVTH